MFTNHLKVAGRNLMKRKEFSMLNLLGLSIGMAACLLILQYVKYEMNYDKFYKDASRIYRLNLGMSDPDKVGVGMMSTNHPAAGPALK
ncbi:MAG: ABC transporter permease, partial [Reichenbachiella sp.]